MRAAALLFYIHYAGQGHHPPLSDNVSPSTSFSEKIFRREMSLINRAGDPLDRTHPFRDLRFGICHAINMLLSPAGVAKARHQAYLRRQELADEQRAKNEKLEQAALARAAQAERASHKAARRAAMGK